MQERSRSRACSLSLCRPRLRLPWFLTGKELSSYTGVLHPHFVEGKSLSLGTNIFSPCDPHTCPRLFGSGQCGPRHKKKQEGPRWSSACSAVCSPAGGIFFFFLEVLHKGPGSGLESRPTLALCVAPGSFFNLSELVSFTR